MADRRAELEARLSLPFDGVEAASSGCAEDGAHRLALKRSDDARRALERFDAGLDGICEACGSAIDPERLTAVVTAIRCVTC